MTKRAVLFDAAGTLIRLRENPGATYASFAASEGAVVPVDRLGEAFSRVFRAAPPMVFPGLGPEATAEAEKAWWKERVRETFRTADRKLSFPNFDVFFEKLWRHFAEAENWKLTPGTGEALTELGERGLILGVLSNFDHRLHGLLEGLGIRKHFACVVLPADAGAAKPDPRIFHHALDSLAVSPGSGVYVGDDPEDDIAGARGAGMAAIDVGELATLAELPARVAALLTPPLDGEHP